MSKDTSNFFNELIDGKGTHRLCIDFHHVEGIKEFVGKAKASGLIPSECEPIVIFAQDDSTVWLVGRRKERLIIEH